MSYKSPEVAQINYGDGMNRAFEEVIELALPDTASDWILVPDKVNKITVTVSFSGGASGKMQTTTDKVETVKNGSPVAIDWPFGEVNSDRSEMCHPPTAIRAYQVDAGQMKATMRFQ